MSFKFLQICIKMQQMEHYLMTQKKKHLPLINIFGFL